MPTYNPQYAALANMILGASQSTVTFSNIPVGYRDLRLVANKTLTAQANSSVRFNGDSGNNYYSVGIGFNWQPVVGSFNDSPNNAITDHWGYPSTPSGAISYLDILDYAATDKHKVALVRLNGMTTDGNWGMDQIAARWGSTTAVTSITLSLSTGQFAAGSTFTLYGVR